MFSFCKSARSLFYQFVSAEIENFDISSCDPAFLKVRRQVVKYFN